MHEFTNEKTPEFIDAVTQWNRVMGWKAGKVVGWEEGKKKTLIASIKNLMGSLKITAEKAMDALKIKKEDREMYLKALQK